MTIFDLPTHFLIPLVQFGEHRLYLSDLRVLWQINNISTFHSRSSGSRSLRWFSFFFRFQLSRFFHLNYFSLLGLFGFDLLLLLFLDFNLLRFGILSVNHAVRGTRSLFWLSNLHLSHLHIWLSKNVSMRLLSVKMFRIRCFIFWVGKCRWLKFCKTFSSFLWFKYLLRIENWLVFWSKNCLSLDNIRGTSFSY